MLAFVFMTRCLAPIFIVGLFAVGCASVSDTRNRLVAFQSYDLPGSLDSNAVVDAVERSFARTLLMAPRIMEGSVPSPLPTIPARFTLENQRVHLARLGVVAIPHVGCPQSMAIVHGFAANTTDDFGLHSLTGCIQLYTGGYRVQIIESVVSDARHVPISLNGMGHHFDTDLLFRVVRAFIEQISDARLAQTADVQEPAASILQIEETPSIGLDSSSEKFAASFPTRSDYVIVDRGQRQEEHEWQASPLVCLAPKRESATVRSQPEGGSIVRILNPGSILAVPEPVDSNYFQVNTENGPRGWVNRSDVKRLPCPIG